MFSSFQERTLKIKILHYGSQRHTQKEGEIPQWQKDYNMYELVRESYYREDSIATANYQKHQLFRAQMKAQNPVTGEVVVPLDQHQLLKNSLPTFEEVFNNLSWVYTVLGKMPRYYSNDNCPVLALDKIKRTDLHQPYGEDHWVNMINTSRSCLFSMKKNDLQAMYER